MNLHDGSRYTRWEAASLGHSLGPTSLYKNNGKCLYAIKYHGYLHTEIYINAIYVQNMK